MTEWDVLRDAVSMLCLPGAASPDSRLLLADALDELAAEQAIDRPNGDEAFNTLTLSKQLRAAVQTDTAPTS